MDARRVPLWQRLLSFRYSTAVAVLFLVLTLNSTLLFFSQLLQQSNSRLYHHGESRSYMGINVQDHPHNEDAGNENEILSKIRTLTTSTDNISGKNMEHIMSFPPVDIVYTWVNGSDPRQVEALLQAKLAKMTTESGTVMRVCNETENAIDHGCYKDEETASRFQDNQELRYSLRSVWKYAPWVRNIYIITNGQIPSWLNLQHPRIHMVTHKAIFANSSHLPTFSSPAIEANMHRIPGLSDHFLYLNDDVMFGNEISPSDFYTYGNGQRVYFSWQVPDCAEGCGSSWLGDGYCDVACNVSACDFDNGDCVNVTSPQGSGWGWGSQSTNEGTSHCSSGCLDTWLGDRYCDRTCRNPECGMDAGDCGMELVYQTVFGISFSPSNVYSISPSAYTSLAKDEIPILHLGSQSAGHHYDLTQIVYFNLSEIVQSRTLVESAYSNPQLIRVITLSPKNNVMIVYFNPSALNSLTPDSGASSSTKATPQDENSVTPTVNATKVKEGAPPSTHVEPPGRIFITFTTRTESSGETTEHLFYIQLHKPTQPDTSSSPEPRASNSTESNVIVPKSHQDTQDNLRQSTRELLWVENVDSSSTGTSDLGDDMTAFLASANPRLEEKTLRRLQRVGRTREQIEEEKALFKKSGREGFDYGGLPDVRSILLDHHNGDVISTELSTQKGGGRRLLDNYAESLKYVNNLLNKAFSPETRRVPAHMPHYLQKSVVERMQKMWPVQFEETSSHHFRAGNDMQYALTYFYYYMSERVGYNFTEVWASMDVDMDGVLNMNEMRTVGATLVRSDAANPRPSPRTAFSNWNSWASQRDEDPSPEPVQKWLKQCDEIWLHWMPELAVTPVETANEVAEMVGEDAQSRSPRVQGASNATLGQPGSTAAAGSPTSPVQRLALYNITTLPAHWNLTQEMLLNCSSAMRPVELHYKARLLNRYELGDAEQVAFVMVPTNRSKAISSLDGIRHRRHKFVCLNDNINHTDPHSEEVVNALHEFYTALFPLPSPFELPEGQTNKFLHTDELLATRTEIKRKKTQIYILVGVVIAILILAIKLFSRNKKGRTQPAPHASSGGGMIRHAHHLRHPDPNSRSQHDDV